MNLLAKNPILAEQPCLRQRYAHRKFDERHFRILYLLEGVPVTVCAVASVAWEGSPGVSVSG